MHIYGENHPLFCVHYFDRYKFDQLIVTFIPSCSLVIVFVQCSQRWQIIYLRQSACEAGLGTLSSLLNPHLIQEGEGGSN